MGRQHTHNGRGDGSQGRRSQHCGCRGRSEIGPEVLWRFCLSLCLSKSLIATRLEAGQRRCSLRERAGSARYSKLGRRHRSYSSRAGLRRETYRGLSLRWRPGGGGSVIPSACSRRWLAYSAGYLFFRRGFPCWLLGRRSSRQRLFCRQRCCLVRRLRRLYLL
jgi:hypothetical protein